MPTEGPDISVGKKAEFTIYRSQVRGSLPTGCFSGIGLQQTPHAKLLVWVWITTVKQWRSYSMVVEHPLLTLEENSPVLAGDV